MTPCSINRNVADAVARWLAWRWHEETRRPVLIRAQVSVRHCLNASIRVAAPVVPTQASRPETRSSIAQERP